jgi:hypothetical protein
VEPSAEPHSAASAAKDPADEPLAGNLGKLLDARPGESEAHEAAAADGGHSRLPQKLLSEILGIELPPNDYVKEP